MKKIFCITFLLLLSVGIYYQYTSNTESKETFSLLHEPLFQSGKISTSVYDIAGKLRYKVIAENVKYFDETSETYFKSPELYFFELNNELAWQITANSAKLTKEKLIFFDENVIITNLTPDSQLKKIISEHFMVNLINQQINSDENVMIEGSSFISKGIGFFGNLRDKTASILKDVTTNYMNE